MAVVHVYARYSTDKQDEGDSTRRQTENPAEYIKRNKHQLGRQFFDHGKSGFSGNKQQALRDFFAAIKSGQVKPGDILLVEAVDRLSRKGIRETQKLVNRIFDAGVDIAILMPVEKVYRASDANDIGGAIELAAFSYAAHIYSAMLSKRTKEAWETARQKAREGEKVTGPIPCWLQKKNGGYKVIPEAKKVIQFIFQRTIEGIGGTTLTQELNQKFKPIAGRKGSTKWNKTFVRGVIRNRQVLGEFQPHVQDDQGQRQPTGEVIPDYYPQIINEKTWLAANSAMNNRSKETGPKKLFVNIFKNLLHFAMDDCPAHIYTYQQKRAGGQKVIIRRYKSYNAVSGVPGATTHTIDVTALEDAILCYLREIDPSQLAGKKSSTIELQAEQGRANKIKKEIAELASELHQRKGKASYAFIADAIDEKEAEHKLVLAEVRRLSAMANHTPEDSFGKLKKLKLETTEDRERTRELLKQIISQINLATVKLGKQKHSRIAACIEICFKAGHRRTIILLDRETIAITDPNPEGPSLAERPDKEDWLKKFKQTVIGIVSETDAIR